MYIVTGGAGFIGSAVVAKLNAQGIQDVIVVDELGSSDKWLNLRNKQYLDYLDKDTFRTQVEGGKRFPGLKGIIHMGACSSTTEQNLDFLLENNFRYTRTLLEYALTHHIRFIYASSAATYGDGALGYSDDDAVTPSLLPLNRYGYSKQLLDLHVLRNRLQLNVVGLKFFNVYGPNEAHKGEMQSVVRKAYQQIKESGSVKLFKSYHPHYKDGEQQRDFIYVKDCADVIYSLLSLPTVNGIFNLGSGKARSWNDLVHAVYAALGKKPEIEYIDMPPSLRNQYQYFTEAKMEKLRSSGCPTTVHSLEEGVKDYVMNYLETGKIL